MNYVVLHYNNNNNYYYYYYYYYYYCEVSTRPEVRCTRCGWARG